MYNAPAVSYPVGRSHIKRLITGGLLCLTLGLLIFWSQQLGRLAWPQGLTWGLWFLSLGLALYEDLRSPHGNLHWDGHGWHWDSAGQSWVVEVRPQLDGQEFVLLAVRGAQPGLDWLWLERQSAPANWDAVRRAVWAQSKIRVGKRNDLMADQP